MPKRFSMLLLFLLVFVALPSALACVQAGTKKRECPISDRDCINSLYVGPGEVLTCDPFQKVCDVMNYSTYYYLMGPSRPTQIEPARVLLRGSREEIQSSIRDSDFKLSQCELLVAFEDYLSQIFVDSNRELESCFLLHRGCKVGRSIFEATVRLTDIGFGSCRNFAHCEIYFKLNCVMFEEHSSDDSSRFCRRLGIPAGESLVTTVEIEFSNTRPKGWYVSGDRKVHEDEFDWRFTPPLEYCPKLAR